MARFYAANAPSWWPYQLVSLANGRLPPAREPGFYHVLIDNGMFAYLKAGARPDLDKWYHRLMLFIRDVERLRKPAEVWVILPDWLGDFEFTYGAARHPLARRICRDYPCLVVAHAEPRHMLPEVGGYAYAASIYASLDHVAGLAAPLKLNCSRYSARAGRRIVRLECQAAIVQQVCGTARRYNLKCHGLGAVLKPEHVARLARLGMDSFDSSSWTRPNTTVLEKLGLIPRRWSAKNTTEKDLFFTIVLQRLREAGVELEQVNSKPLGLV